MKKDFDFGVLLGEEATLKLIYEEVMKVSRRLESLEEVLEEIILRDLPEAEMTPEEHSVHEKRLEEMQSGDWVPIEDLSHNES